MAAQTTEGARLSELELFTRWSDRWDHFLSDFDTTSGSGEVSERLRDKVKSGNAERAIAGGHEGREVLDLLQNARDAVGSEMDGGRVYIGVYDEGVLVANTGSPFDLFDPDVEDAVTMIGESSKGGSDQEIGHKGVGLKSVLATGEAFEIWTRHESATNEQLRVRLSRSYVTSALLDSLGYDTAQVGLRGDICDEDIASLTAPSDTNRTGQLDHDARADIGKLPLFDFPVPLKTNTSPDDPVADRAEQLLAGENEEWYGEPFRTAVFVEYEDQEWQTLLDTFNIPRPEGSNRDADERADRLWSYLSQQADESGLTPETLVQFGGIESLLLERVEETGQHDREQWDVSRETGELDDSESLRHQCVTVSIDGLDVETASRDVRFDQFERDDVASSSQLLVPRALSAGGRPQSYPLYLYYPIENTRDIELPFCLHGHFTVETNRKDLSRNSLDDNRDVLEEGIELIGHVAEAAAASDFGARYPWILLPPPPAMAHDEPHSQASLLTWFCAEIYDELRTRSCLPTVGGERSGETATGVTLSDALLHWDSAIRDGFYALYDVVESLERDRPITDASISRSFPTRKTLEGWRSLPELWESRVAELIAAQDEEAFSADIARQWATLLDTHLHKQQFEQGMSHAVDTEAAQSLFTGTIETILQAGTDDKQLASTLDDVSADLDGVYLLPCRRTREDSDRVGEPRSTQESLENNSQPDPETLFLVPIEPRTGSTSNVPGANRTRSVIWDVGAAERDGDPPEVPHEATSFNLFFLDRKIEQNERARRVLDRAGRQWGIRVYDGAPSYFRELLDTFATSDSAAVNALDFYFLANQIHKLGDESTDLRMGEGDFLQTDYLEGAVKQSDGDRRQNLRRRLELRNSQISLLQDGGTWRVLSTILGDDWQRLRAKAHETDTEDWGSFDGHDLAAWPEPESAAWEKLVAPLPSDDARERIAKTLSLFGASVLPEIRSVWMYGAGHPRPPSNAPWDPLEWSAENFQTRALLERTTALQQTLEQAEGRYQQWITAPGRHPQTTAEHSDKCPVKTDGVLSDVSLASWVWADDPAALQQLGESNLTELLTRYNTAFENSLLHTGWACSNGHQRDGYGWSQSVPTVLNWQLRHLDIWNSTVSVRSDVEDLWDEDGAQLTYAVAKTSSQGAQTWRLFPHVDAATSPIPESTLQSLGVKPVAAFDATESGWHLQRLLAGLADGVLADAPVPIEIPDERRNDWNAAYTALLEPILTHLTNSEPDSATDTLSNLFLSHLPIKRNGEWQVASVEWLSDNAENGRYYEDQSPKPWERDAVEGNPDRWLLPRTATGPFTQLADLLGVAGVDVSKPVFNPDDLSFGDPDTSLERLQSLLREREILLVASLEQTSEKRIREFTTALETAIDGLRVAERFPEEQTSAVTSLLVDRESALYAPQAGTEAFVLNNEAFDGEPTLNGLASAIALLAEQPTKASIFREVLDPDRSVDELEERWRRRTFPVDDVERILGSRRRRRLRQRLTALVSLSERFGETVTIPVENVLDELERDHAPDIDDFEQLLRGEHADADTSSTAATFAIDLRAALPDDVLFVLQRLFGTSHESWSSLVARSGVADDSEVEVQLIEWLASHTDALDAQTAFPQSVKSEYIRARRVLAVWDRTDTDELQDIDVWRSRLSSLSTDESVAWSDELPERLQHDDASGARLFYYTPESRFRSLVVEPLFEAVHAALDVENPIQTALRQYVHDGNFPVDETTSAADHQEGALDDLQDAALQNRDFISEEIRTPTFGKQHASVNVGGRGNGGGSTQYRGRGQQGEAMALASILEDTAEWLADEPKGTIRSLRSSFRKLRDEQIESEYNWHLDRVWEQELQPLLSSGQLTRDTIVNWRDTLDAGRRLRDHPLVRLCNVTLEHGPGYDVIDPLGSLTGPRDVEFDQFAPVEVKAVGGQSPPFRFRLTTNEFRQCKAFLRSGRPYIIRLVYVPDVDTPDWSAEARFVSEIVLDDVSQAEALVSENPFEEVVKGGYMNMSVDEQRSDRN